MFTSFLDQQGKDQRNLEMERAKKTEPRENARPKAGEISQSPLYDTSADKVFATGIIAEGSKIILDQSTHYRHHVPPFMDNVARFIWI